jgi:predicted nucleic acid-binding protein
MNFMSVGKIFVDTNVLIYAYDVSAGVKHLRAMELVTELWKLRTGLVSTQVLQEFYVTATRKIARPLESSFARQIVADLSRWEVVTIEPKTILAAIDLQRDHLLSFWDAMIVTTAANGSAEILFTEDLNHGQVISGVTVQNPFL